MAPAEFHILLPGALEPMTISTCSLILDGDARIVVDPGIAPSQAAITEPLRRHGLEVTDVTDVVISHHHPDHTLNVALFPAARVHDHWAIYDFYGRWDSAAPDGREVSPNVHLLATPGHSAEDISTAAETKDGLVVFSHAWWTADLPHDDPFSPDLTKLRTSRARILEIAAWIVPGHGEPFRPTPATPR